MARKKLWTNPWETFGRAAVLSAEAQSVIALRLARLSRGGQLAQSEAARMVIEKGTTFLAAQAAAAVALPFGGMMFAAETAMATYRHSVRANYNRLSRRRRATKPSLRS
jgi:hypothetical protein